MASGPLDIVCIADGNVSNFGAILKRGADEPAVDVRHAPFGSVLPVLLDAGHDVWSPEPDAAIVWTRPESVLPTYADALRGEQVSPDGIEGDVDAFADAVAAASARARWTLLPTWVPSFGARGLGSLDLHLPGGLRSLLLRANARVVERFGDGSDVYVLDADRWSAAADLGDRRAWYAGKMPFPPTVLRRAAADVRAFLRAATGRSRKILLLDLDNTLWGGVVGETGYEGIRLGGHDPVGEAFVDFQHALKALTRRGVVLAIVSKNDEAVALEAIRRHPEMVLRESDFAGWRINWRDKATNVSELMEELRLGVDSAVFIDDQPAERGRVSEAIPDVLVPDWPTDPLGYVAALESLTCFDVLSINTEDLARAQSYAAERQRRALKSSVTSMDDWLRELDIRVDIRALDAESLPRAAQLLNKTNQMNMATRRMSEAELEEWAARADRAFLTVRVADRFSDFGLTGLLGLEADDSTVHVVDFVLSCRVMSRQVEEAMAHAAVEFARTRGASRVEAKFLRTDRNAPMLAFWRERSRYFEDDEYTFHRDAADDYPPPRAIQLEMSGVE